MKYKFYYGIVKEGVPEGDIKEFIVEAENELDAGSKFDIECSQYLQQGYSIELLDMQVEQPDVLAEKEKAFNDALENLGEPVQPTSLKDINDEISKVDTHNHEEVKKVLNSFDSPSSGSGQAIQDDADHTPPAAPAKSGLSAPPEGNETFTFTFMVIKGIDTMDRYIDVTDVEAKTEHEAFLLACEQVTISCPEKRKIWYKGKPLEHYGYVPKTIPQDGKK